LEELGDETKQRKIDYLLNIVKKTKQILEKEDKKIEAQKIIQRIEEKTFFLSSEEKCFPKTNKETDWME